MMLVEWHVIGTCCMQCDSCLCDQFRDMWRICHALHASTQYIWVWHFDAHTDMQRTVKSSSSSVNRTSVDWTYSYTCMYTILHAVNWHCKTIAQHQPWCLVYAQDQTCRHIHTTLSHPFVWLFISNTQCTWHVVSYCFVWIELLFNAHWLPTLLSNRVALFISSRWDVSRCIVYTNTNERMITI